MSNKLQLKLRNVDGDPVTLTSMSSEALDSFLIAMSNLRDLATSVAGHEGANFQIVNGSACGILEFQDASLMESIYSEIDDAINNDSTNKEVTGTLRSIQKEIKRVGFEYDFDYFRNGSPSNYQRIQITDRLINRPLVSVRRIRKNYDLKLVVKQGYLNQIGGENPNYHFDWGSGDVTTIKCSKDQAKEIREYLYSRVDTILLRKEYIDTDKKTEFIHKAIIKRESQRKYRNFLSNYYEEDNLVERLLLVHNLIDDSFEENPQNALDDLKYIVQAFNDKELHLSEIKTALILSKPYREVKHIRDYRQKLLETYKRKKNNAKPS